MVFGSNLNLPSNPPTKLRFFGNVRAEAKNPMLFSLPKSRFRRSTPKFAFLSRNSSIDEHLRGGPAICNIVCTALLTNEKFAALVFRVIAGSVVRRSEKSERGFSHFARQFYCCIRINYRPRIKRLERGFKNIFAFEKERTLFLKEDRKTLICRDDRSVGLDLGIVGIDRGIERNIWRDACI